MIWSSSIQVSSKGTYAAKENKQVVPASGLVLEVRTEVTRAQNSEFN